MPASKDDLFANPLDIVPQFRFDQKVVDVFPDMIARSVPGYATILHCIGQLAERHAQPGTHCYDLGCSLGAGLLAMRQRVQHSDVTLTGIDNSEAMIERCRSLLADSTSGPSIELLHADVLNVDFQPMSVCVLNFTLQFIPPAQRQTLLDRIAVHMQPGGVLVLSEKLRFEDEGHQQLMTELHHDFKRLNGYTELEIAQKRQAIEDVLIPETFSTHRDRLEQAGFRGAELWFQCFNFASIIAIK